MHVLVVMSNRFNRRLVANLVRSTGIGAVDECEDADAAFKQMQHMEPGMLVVGLDLAPEDGIAFTRQIRTDQTSPAHRAPIILVADKAMRETVVAARDAGINEFLVAPLSNRSLKAHLLAAVDRQRRFVEDPSYAGPDRRRTHGPGYAGPDRRTEEEEAAALAAEAAAVAE